jgi:hypothetical protein
MNDAFVALLIIGIVAAVIVHNRWWDSLSEDEQRARTYGPINPALLCPHCQEKGHVRTQAIDQKKGISGGKAAGAVLTTGVSILFAGLSRHETNTQAYCDNCHSTWVF